MPASIHHEVEAGELGALTLEWDAHGLGWRHPDRSVGETSGHWAGLLRLKGSSLGRLSLGPHDTVLALWNAVPGDGTSPEHHGRVTAWIARRGEELVVELPPPGEWHDAYDERGAA